MIGVNRGSQQQLFMRLRKRLLMAEDNGFNEGEGSSGERTWCLQCSNQFMKSPVDIATCSCLFWRFRIVNVTWVLDSRVSFYGY